MVCKILFFIIYFFFQIILIFYMIQLVIPYTIQIVENEINDQQLQQFEQQSDNNDYGI